MTTALGRSLQVTEAVAHSLLATGLQASAARRELACVPAPTGITVWQSQPPGSRLENGLCKDNGRVVWQGRRLHPRVGQATHTARTVPSLSFARSVAVMLLHSSS